MTLYIVPYTWKKDGTVLFYVPSKPGANLLPETGAATKLAEGWLVAHRLENVRTRVVRGKGKTRVALCHVKQLAGDPADWFSRRDIFFGGEFSNELTVVIACAFEEI